MKSTWVGGIEVWRDERYSGDSFREPDGTVISLVNGGSDRGLDGQRKE